MFEDHIPSYMFQVFLGTDNQRKDGKILRGFSTTAFSEFWINSSKTGLLSFPLS